MRIINYWVKIEEKFSTYLHVSHDTSYGDCVVSERNDGRTNISQRIWEKMTHESQKIEFFFCTSALIVP